MNIQREKTEQEVSFENVEKVTVTGDDGTIMTLVKDPIIVSPEGNIYWAQIHGIDLIAKELVIPPAFAEDSTLITERFIKTSSIMAGIEDPTLTAKVWGRVESGGRQYLLLYPYFKDGKEIKKYNSLTLDKQFQQIEFHMPKTEIFDIVTQLSKIIIKLKERGLYHMDLKPGNLVYYDGLLKLIDFGLLIDRREGIDPKKRVPDPSYLIGTPEYSSPERILLHSSPEDAGNLNYYASEIFSFASIVFKLITRQSLTRGATELESANNLLDIDLSNPKNQTTLNFNFIIDGLKDYSTAQKDKLKEAFKLLFVEDPEERIKHFPIEFLTVLSEAFDDGLKAAA